MKNLLSVLLVSFLTFGTSFATEHDKGAKEEVKKEEVKKETPKAAEDFKEGEVKKVCVVINGKEKCKKMKMHHKVEGTKVPTPVKKGK